MFLLVMLLEHLEYPKVSEMKIALSSPPILQFVSCL
jgi:hypothetical protein